MGDGGREAGEILWTMPRRMYANTLRAPISMIGCDAVQWLWQRTPSTGESCTHA